MTSRELLKSALTETSKVKAPSLLLEDYIHFINKAIQQYVNKRYNVYDTSAQTMDDLRVLKSTAMLSVKKTTAYQNELDIIDPTSPLSEYKKSLSASSDCIYEFDLPDDYFHILNCMCIFKVNKNYQCYTAGSYKKFAATRLDSDKWSQIVNDYYNQPEYKRPYYFIHNVNIDNSEYTNLYNSDTKTGTDQGLYSMPTDLYNVGIEKLTYSTNNGLFVEISINTRADLATAKFTDSKVMNKIKNLFDITTDELTAEVEMPNETNYNTKTYKIKTGINSYLVYNTISGELSTMQSELDNWKFVRATYQTQNNSFNRAIALDQNTQNGRIQIVDLVNKPAGSRHANASKVRCEVRYGSDNSIFELIGVQVDYIKAPQKINITEEQMALVDDTSQILEFPDYVCNEILNELVHILMENAADPRLQTHSVVSQSIASPAQQQTTQPAATTA